VFAPLSIPSPPDEWQSLRLGDWLRDLGLTFITWPLEIRFYALAILVGIIAAVILTGRRLTARGVEPGLVLDISLFAVPLGIVGARIFHVLTHPSDYFGPGKDLLKTLYIWEGGIAIFGALIGGAIGVYIACRLTGLRFWTFADALAPGLLLAQAFGRLGNWFNHELFGWPTDVPWALEIPSPNAAIPVGLPEGTLFHPTFLYEIIWNLLGVLVLLYLERKWSIGRKAIAGLSVPVLVPGRIKLQWGKMLALYLIWYGLGRTVWETIRIDPSEVFFGIRTNVWAAFGAVVLGVLILVIQSRRHYGAPPSPYRRGHKGYSVVDSEETYSETPAGITAEPGTAPTGKDAAAVPSEAPVTSGPATSGPGTSGKGAS